MFNFVCFGVFFLFLFVLFSFEVLSLLSYYWLAVVGFFIQLIFLWLSVSFSFSFLFMMEFVLLTILYWFLRKSFLVKECVLVLFGFSLLVFYVFLGMEEGSFGFSFVFSLVFFSFLMKYGVCSSFLLCLVRSCLILFSLEDSNYVFMYLISSKPIIFLYGLFFSSVSFDIVLESVFGVFGGFMIILFWVFMVGVSWVLLGNKDLEGFLVHSFGLSQFLSVFSVFISLSVFFVCVCMDCFLSFLFFYLMCSGINLFLFSFLSGGSVVLFMLMCQCFSLPPFPSFYLEMNFLVLFYIMYGGSFSFLFVGVVCLFYMLMFVFFCFWGISKYYGGVFLGKMESFKVWFFCLYIFIYFSFWVYYWWGMFF